MQLWESNASFAVALLSCFVAVFLALVWTLSVSGLAVVALCVMSLVARCRGLQTPPFRSLGFIVG